MVILAQAVSKLLLKSRLGITLRESLVISGWVALWKPVELLLYDWYHLRVTQICLKG